MSGPLNDKVLTVVGAYETHKGTDKPYDTISVQELMTIPRTTVPKDQARWVLCSTYNEADGRTHKAQEANGQFVMLAVDLDSGNVQGKSLIDAVQSFTGPAQMRAYASSSATKDSRKWRVLIPLASAIPFTEWLTLSTALNQHIEARLGQRPDRALERAGQPIYLPNTAPRTDGIEPLTSDKLVDGPLFAWRESEAAVAAVEQVAADEAARQAEIDQRAAEARRKMAQMRARPADDKSVINEFNAAYDLEGILAACGYVQGPRGGWKSPRQTTDSHATKVFDEPAGQYWVSLSLSDLEAGVGSHTSDGRCCFGDAFDVWSFTFYANDRTAAIKAAAAELGIKRPPSGVDMLAERIRANQMAASAAPAAVAPTPAPADDPQPEAPQASPAPASAPAEEEPEEGEATRTLPFVQASVLPDWDAPQELVEGMLMQGGMTVIYGDSNTGKSFLTLDMVAHISLGLPWMNRQVKQAAVIYLAAESPRSIIDRARALERHLDQPLHQLFIVNCPLDLYDEQGETLAVVNTICKIERQFNVKVGCIVADTLARVIGSGDENKAQDMGVVIQHIDLIRAATGAQFILVHHTGKDKTNGARGSSALRAATDTEIEVSDNQDGTPKIATVTKQRDLPGKNTSLGFDLAVVELGAGIFGNVFTTCVVEAKAVEGNSGERDLSPVQREILAFIRAQPTSVRRSAIADYLRVERPNVNDSTITRALDRLQRTHLIGKMLSMYFATGVDAIGVPRSASAGEF
jgi:hypothetical protein